MSVAVIIPAYNEEASIADTIRSVLTQTRPPEQLIVVDDCSTDRTGEVARAHGAQVVRPARNQGTKAQAQNVALPLVGAEITVTIDADTTLAPDALEKLIAPFERDPDLALASGYLVPRHLDTVWERGRLVEYLYGLELYKTAQAAVGAPIVCSGAFSAFRTSVLREHGGFDAGTMAEDLNFTWKVHMSGGKATFVEGAICYPVDPRTWPIYFKQVDRWVRAFFQNLMLFSHRLHRKPMLAVFIWLGVFEAFLFPAALVATAYTVLTATLFERDVAWISWLAGLTLVDAALVTAFAIRGGIRARCLPVVLRSVHLYFLLRMVNAGLWWRGFILEVLLGRRLTVWSKGH
ncbi:MAG: glycosyltransferase family 2 protein [Armatimonadota bacterium]|nr:glycosyltransferase family 2 protein [Armatimonadota bacterium]